MEIWTDGSVTPQEALSQSAHILVDLFAPLKDITQDSLKPEYPGEADPTSQIPIEELQLSVRAYNCLKRARLTQSQTYWIIPKKTCSRSRISGRSPQKK